MAGSPSPDAPEQIPWDLSDVLPGTEGPEFTEFVQELEDRVDDLEAQRGRLEDVTSPREVRELWDLYADVGERAKRLQYMGSLRFSTDTSDDAVKAYMTRMDERTTEISNRLRFLPLWWKNLPEERVTELTPEDPDLAYHLERLRAYAPYTLTEAEERIIAIKDDTGSTALGRLREILTSGFRFQDPKTGEEVTQSVLTKRVYDPDPEVREAAYQEVWRVYAEHESELAYLYQNVVQDWANEHLKLRGYDAPIEPRNMANDVPGEVVDAMLAVCRENRDLFHRYFTWKGEQLDIEPMTRYHIYAPLEMDQPDVDYASARKQVLDTFANFSPRVEAAARRVFERDHVHVYPDDHKRSGAYCATVNHDITPYVFLNYTGDASSVKTLAHEMGHAVHSILAEDRHPLVAHAPLPLAETASVFSEMLLHDRLLASATPEQRRGLVSEKLHEIYATVMRQAYFAIFEKDAHAALLEGATAQDIHSLYLENLREQFGPMEVPEAFQREWTYIPHFYQSPFYVYAYSFGMLLSLALYGVYREEGQGMVPNYVDLLAVGGSRAPADAVMDTVGVDIRDEAFWQRGFDVIEEMVNELDAS